MQLSELAAKLQADHRGEASITAVASVVSAKSSDLVYAADEKHLGAALNSKAAAVVAGEFARQSSTKKPLIIAKNPKLAFARAAKLLQEGIQKPAGINPTAIVVPEENPGKGVFVAPLCVIAGGTIGDGTHIGARTTIAPDVVIGNNCNI